MKYPILRCLGIACAAAAARPAGAQQLTPAQRSAIDSTLAGLFGLGLAPGMGIVVVRDTQVVYLKGLGYADAESHRPFTPRTVFYVASTTKSFTGLAAAMLDLQGKFSLDAPLSRYLPEARLKPPRHADSITIRQLLSHSHGIAGGPVEMRLAYTGEYQGNDQLVALLAEHNALPDLSYRYSNLGYNVAALAMERVTGESWKETLQRLIFTPLGMKSTSAFVSRFPAEQLAMPYGSTPTGYERIRYGKTDANMQSAGGLVTTLEDAARWLEVHLNDGRLDGSQVLPAAAIREAHRPQARYSRDARGLSMVGYGLGWNIGLLNGRDTLFIHGGGFPGFSTSMSFAPVHRLGIVVMANTGDLGGALTELAARAVYGIVTGGAPLTADSLAVLRGMVARERENIRTDRARRAARPQITPLPFAAYAGRYENPLMGTLVLTLDREGKLEASAGVAWSGVEVFDGGKHQLRVELFGSGSVLTMHVEGDRVVSATLNGHTFRRVP
jgi:CubicO group peptidase (beta-lactamase class C family)